MKLRVVAAYSHFGPTSVYDLVTADEHGASMVFAGELADGYANGCHFSGKPQPLEPEQAADRLWNGMLEHGRPLAMIAGDAGCHWGHVTDVARLLLDRSTGKQMMFPDGPEWMGVIVEVDPRSIRVRQVRTFVHELGDESERLVIALWAGGDTAEAEKWVRALYPPEPPKRPPTDLVIQTVCPTCDAQTGAKCVKPNGDLKFAPHPSRVVATPYEPPPRSPVPALMVCFDDRVDHAKIMRVYRALERREPRRGRGVLLLPRRERLFASSSPSIGGR